MSNQLYRSRFISIFVFVLLSILTVSGEITTTVNKRTQSVLQNQRFDEELLVRSLAPGDLSALQFQFTVREVIHESSLNTNGRRHFNLFPRALGLLVKEHDVLDARVSLGKGRWDSSRWGSELQPTAGGAELYGRLRNPSAEAWDQFTRSLSGSLLCLGLDQLSSAQTVVPSFLGGATRYGVLPRETSCTENLSHWLKLLPTRSLAGLASLIVPSDVLHSPYHAMRFHVKRACLYSGEALGGGCVNGSVALELSMSLTFLVSDTQIEKLGARGFVRPSPVATASLVHFKTFTPGCPDNIDQSVTTIALQETNSSSSLLTLEQMIREHLSADSNQVWDATTDGDEKGTNMHSHQCSRYVSVLKSLVDETGTGGTMVITVENAFSTGSAWVRVMDLVPPFLNARFASLRVYVNGTELTRAELLEVLTLTPQSSRTDPSALIELSNVSVPAGSSLTLSYQFSKRFLQLDAFPADPNRGFDVPSAVAKLTLINASSEKEQADASSPLLSHRARQQTDKQGYSEGLLVMLPLPDFSMPYNVVTLSSTALAFFFGTMVNILTRRRNPSATKGARPNLVERIKTALCRKHSKGGGGGGGGEKSDKVE